MWDSHLDLPLQGVGKYNILSKNKARRINTIYKISALVMLSLFVI